MNIGKGTEDNPYTHGSNDIDRRQKYCKCGNCGNIEKCSMRRDFWGFHGQALLCEDCCGPYGENKLPKDF